MVQGADPHTADHAGWVKVEDFTWSSSKCYVQVDVVTNRVKVWHGDKVIVD